MHNDAFAGKHTRSRTTFWPTRQPTSSPVHSAVRSRQGWVEQDIQRRSIFATATAFGRSLVALDPKSSRRRGPSLSPVCDQARGRTNARVSVDPYRRRYRQQGQGLIPMAMHARQRDCESPRPSRSRVPKTAQGTPSHSKRCSAAQRARPTHRGRPRNVHPTNLASQRRKEPRTQNLARAANSGAIRRFGYPPESPAGQSSATLKWSKSKCRWSSRRPRTQRERALARQRAVWLG
mmetsp:Transcript_44195/g.128637  ORF Transcript_44195/g.128637 Transcript_44195/m.128637 type:complete len:235 (-) Transcript_44195:546-1250(-)